MTATDGTTAQSSSATFSTKNDRTAHTAWYELPAATEGNNMQTHSFYASSQRNYTMLYDKSTYTAYWVAYPLTASHLGTGRSDAWQKTPDIPVTDQINIWSGSYNVNVGATSNEGYDSSQNYYARGHQIPNADRNGSPEMVVQTYYATNSTPQIQNKFNSGIWSQLEEDVRGLVSATDTIYVVTGAVLQTVEGSEQVTYITPKWDTKQCPVPNYYYKVLLKVKRDASKQVTSAMTVGIWLPHKEYPGDSATNYTKPVSEIERLTGFDFFANLPDEIQAVAERNSDWETFRSF